jgi:glycine cleavage system H lipoate-binding protein
MSHDLNKCVWMWAGLLTYRLCDREYQCSGCPVEALFHPEAPGAGRVSRSSVPSPATPMNQRLPGWGDRFHDSQHLWLRVLPAGDVQIGFDPMAANLLRTVQWFEAPEPGTSVRAGEIAVRAHLEGSGDIVEFASPVSGDVVRTHQPTPGRLASMLRSPYTRAWIMVLKVQRLEQQLSRLSFGRAAGRRIGQDWSRLQEECLGQPVGSPAGQPVLPDGGELDPERLASWFGSAYPALVRRWIGVSRAHTGRSSSRAPGKGRASRGGATAPPEER